MKYIEIVGIDGAGKSRLCRALRSQLGNRAAPISLSMVSDATAQVVQSVSTDEGVCPVARCLTYMAAHAEVYDKIEPRLDTVDFLIGDRGYACFYAYHHEVTSSSIDELWRVAMRGIFPDLLVLLDTPVEVCQHRISQRHYPSMIDQKPAVFHEGVRQRYLAFCDVYQHKADVLILDGRHKRDHLVSQILKRYGIGMKKKREDKTLTEKYLLEQGFEKPIAIVVYTGPRQVKSVIVTRYDLKLDDDAVLKKLDILFAFSLAAYEEIKSGIRLNKDIEAQQLQPITKRSDRPHIADKKGYEAGTGKGVRLTMRTGHILSGKQVFATAYNLILDINTKRVLVYKHGILDYHIQQEV